MRTLFALSLVFLVACGSADTDDSSGSATEPEEEASAQSALQFCGLPPWSIPCAFAAFDDVTSPPAPGKPGAVVLAPWLDYLGTNVVFAAGNDAPRVGRAAVASYFDPLLPTIGSVVHEIDTVSPVWGEENAWTVRGTLRIKRKSNGQSIQAIPFVDTLFFDSHGKKIVRYEIRFDPTPLGQLFAP